MDKSVLQEDVEIAELIETVLGMRMAEIVLLMVSVQMYPLQHAIRL